MKPSLLILMLLAWLPLMSQTAPDKYWIQFTDKNNSSYSVNRPDEYLSQRAIERRERYGIPVTTQDLPVNQSYIDSLTHLGAQVITRSKWFNAATIYTADTQVLERIRNLSFVRHVKSSRQPKPVEPVPDKFFGKLIKSALLLAKTDTTVLQYGEASRQIGMVNGHMLHNQGYQGQGMVIAVLDAGFTNVHISPAFDSLRAGNRILGTWDFVKGGPMTYSDHNHGSQVLSIMAANLPGQLVGTAPEASYYLLRTEDGPTEYLVEEDNWVAGAEYADSVGADLINSSLGYTLFDDSSTNHTYGDMDGNTTRVTIAADIAASKGILVVNSAGNGGGSGWPYIGAPADADSILSVGAVDSLGNLAGFSSVGPTFDGRIKPNIAAQGRNTALAEAGSGAVFRGNGTSYSSPVMCGLAACLWQSNRTLPPMKIIEAIQASASQANNPDSLLGYGIPDFGKAMFLIQGITPIPLDQESLFRIFPNPSTGQIMVEFYSPGQQTVTIELFSMAGQRLFFKKAEVSYTSINRFMINEFSDFAIGTYLIRIRTGKHQHVQKVIRSSPQK